MSTSHTLDEHDAVRQFEEEYQDKIHFYISDDDIGAIGSRDSGKTRPGLSQQINESGEKKRTTHEAIAESIEEIPTTTMAATSPSAVARTIASRGRTANPSGLKLGLSTGEERGRRRASSYDPRIVQDSVKSHPKRACSVSESGPGRTGPISPPPVTELIDEFLAKQPPKSPGAPKIVMSRIPLPQIHTARKDQNVSTLKGGITVGLDHLDNLCRLMHQLALLREENSKLRKRVNYLEDTKAMLKMKNEVLDAKVKKWEYLEDAWKRSSLQKNRSDSALNSTTPEKDLDDEVFGKGTVMQMYPRSGRHQRSLSVGSVEMPEDMEHPRDENTGWGYGKYAEKIFKKSIRLTRWPRETVKKVFGTKGKKLDEGVQSENTVSIVKKKTPTATLSDLKRPGSGSLARKQTVEPRQKKVSSSSVEPSSPSPSSCQSEPGGGIFHDDDDDLTTEIWMGPPGKQDVTSPTTPLNEGSLWFEQKYFGGKDSSRASGSTRGGNKDQFGDDSDIENDKSSTLKRDEPGVLVRRKSSPELITWEEREAKATPSPSRSLSASIRSKREPSPDVERGSKLDLSNRSRTQTAWGKVKDYIHTRKDSLKKRGNKGKLNEDYRKSMNESILTEAAAEYNRKTYPTVSGGPSVSDSAPDLYQSATPCRSPERPSRRSEVQPPTSDALIRKPAAPHPIPTSPSLRSPRSRHTPTHEATSSGGMSRSVDLQSLIDRSSPDGVFEFSSGELHEDRTISPTHTASSSSSTTPLRQHRSMEIGTPKDTGTPKEGAIGPIIVEEMQKKLSDSFSRKLQEWEKIRSRTDTSPTEKKETLKKDTWRNKSDRKSAGDREKQRMEKELAKVEREQQKLEEKRQRLERERDRTLKKEEKLERKREQLEVMVIDGIPSHRKFKYVNVGEYEIQGISEEFAKKLHEWEILKGQKKEHPEMTSDSKNALKCSDLKALTRGDAVRVSRRPAEVILPPTFKEGQLPLPRVVKGHTAKPLLLSTAIAAESEELQHVDAAPQVMRVDPIVHRHHRISTHHLRFNNRETQTSPIETDTDQSFNYDSTEGLRTINTGLKEQLSRQEQAYQGIKDNLDRQGHTMQIMNQNYIKEISALRRQLASSNRLESVIGQSNSVGDTVTELWNRVQQLEKMLRKEQRLGEMPIRRVPAFRGRDSNKPQQDFTFNECDIPPKLIEYISKLHTQVNDLQLGVLERNKMIADMKKHLAIQEAMQVLLKVDLQRREFETNLYRRTRKLRCRRHYTVAGHEFAKREFVEKETLKHAVKVPDEKKLAQNFEMQFKQLPHGKVDQITTPPTDTGEVIDIIKTCCTEPDITTQEASEQFHSCSSSPVHSSSPVRSGATSPKPSRYNSEQPRVRPRSRQESCNSSYSESYGSSSGYQDPNRIGYSNSRAQLPYTGSKSDTSVYTPQIRHETSRHGDKYLHSVSIARATSPMNRQLANRSVKVEIKSPTESLDESIDREDTGRTRAPRRTRAETRAYQQQQQQMQAAAAAAAATAARTSFQDRHPVISSPQPVQHHTWQPSSMRHSPSPYREQPYYSGAIPESSPSFRVANLSSQVTYHQPAPVQTHKPPDSEKSFMRRSASYFSPKPYNPRSADTESVSPIRQRGQWSSSSASASSSPSGTVFIHRRSPSPLRKLNSDSELMIGYHSSATYSSPADQLQSPHAAHVRKPSDQENNNFWQEQSSAAAQHGQVYLSPSTPYVQTAMRKLSCGPEMHANGKTIVTSDGKVKRLTEAFGDSDAERFASSPLLRRRNSREIPKEGTVQKRLEEYVSQAAAHPSPGPVHSQSRFIRRQSHEIPSEGTVAKRLEELRQYYVDEEDENDDDEFSDALQSRRLSESSESTVHASYTTSPATISPQSSPEIKPAREAHVPVTTSQTVSIRTSHGVPEAPPKSPRFLRSMRSGKQTQQKRLSPFEMLVRDTLTLNLETQKIGGSAVEDREPRCLPVQQLDVSSGTEGNERKRSRGRFLGFFKASK
ncbi:uncharacterized protein LOC141903855 isoform X2 [Tubulanus polymorphus]|uniref:uncharacterized protein LOC141903855 isoform X2 n=1 Tax=Tubulanus polymorphus TaxID=672921 RepID=UPI003DA42EC0